MLYLAIPAHNEVATIGVLLWRLRTVLAEFPREYEVVVYDDASTDETAAVAEQYVHAMPVTVLRGATPVGYAGAVNALVRHVAAHTRYPRRDAMLLLQGDFTDPPGIVPEFARRFEGGADLVVGERTAVVDAPVPVRRLFSAAGWALRPFVKVEGVRDLTGSMRLMRIQALRDLLRTVGDDSVCVGDSWTANADLLLRLVPHARRVETVPMEPTYGVRTRDTRRVTVRDALAALRWGWRARGRRAVPTSGPETGADANARNTRPANTSRRRDEPELTADRLRERSRDRDRLRGEQDSSRPRRDGRPQREDRDTSRVAPSAEQKAERRDRKREEKANGKRGEKRNEERTQERNDKRGDKRAVSPDAKSAQGREARASEPRAPRPPRPEQQRRDRKQSLAADAELILDDPFAGPASRSQASPIVPPPSLASDDDAARDDDRLNQALQPASPRADSDDLRVDMRGGASDIDAGTDDDAADDADDVSADSQDGADASSEDAGSAARERKRRRNRRSRRRRAKHRGDAESGPESAAADDSVDAVSATSARTRDVDPSGRNDVERDDVEHDDVEHDDQGGDDDSNADDASEGAVTGEDGAKDQAARARRRGRRGRRGGSRRSRARGRETGESERPSGDSPSAPPSGDGE